MPTIINLDNHAIMSVNINGKDEIFIIKYNENKIVEHISQYGNNKITEIDSISECERFKNVHIDDINDNMIKLIKDFDKALFYLNCAVSSAQEKRRYEKIFGLK